MPYRFLDDIAIADEAFQAWGASLEEMFAAAWDATLNIMVREVHSIRSHQNRRIQIADAQLDMLLFQLLQELIFFKDAEQLLLRIGRIRIMLQENDNWTLEAELTGETIDPLRHDLIVDVKAITLHRFDVSQTAEGWASTVVVDV